jgi:predicted DNA-binding WGR domain protein
MTPLHLRRIDPVRNMRRFYRLDIQPDLFGRILLMKQWGRVGTQGHMMAESYESEDLAIVALQRQAESKRRRGYAGAGDCANPQCLAQHDPEAYAMIQLKLSGSV